MLTGISSPYRKKTKKALLQVEFGFLRILTFFFYFFQPYGVKEKKIGKERKRCEALYAFLFGYCFVHIFRCK